MAILCSLFNVGTSDGYYLYVESSTPAQANDNALLRSQWMDPVYGGQCLKFYYTMYGSTMGELRVHIELEGVATYLLFRESGNKGIGWKNVNKNIDTSVRYRVCTTNAPLSFLSTVHPTIRKKAQISIG